MLFRIANWKWEDITTQRVISAAVAVFDQDRRSHPDVAPVREFYLSEIETREPGAFLDGMVGVYIDSFAPGSDHTRFLAKSLGRRSANASWRNRSFGRWVTAALMSRI